MKIDKISWCIYLIILCHLGEFLFPDIKKIIWSLNVISILLLPYSSLFKLHTQYPRIFIYLFFLFIFFNFLIIIRGFIEPGGQTIWTLLGNPAFIISQLVPLYLLLAYHDKVLKHLYISIKGAIFFGGIFLYFYNIFNIFLRICVDFYIIIFPYINKKKIALILLGIVVFMGYFSTFELENRLDFIGIVFIVIIFLIHIFSEKITSFKKLARFIFLLCFIIPISYLIIGITSGYSVFDLSESFTILANKEQGLSEDTRTFVYMEVFDDLSKNDALYWGKGINGRIYTVLDSETDLTVKDESRLFVEVGVLENMRRGGIFFTFFYYIIMVSAAFYALTKSKNRFLLISSMTIMVFFFLSFLGHNPMFSFECIILWILIGLCYSKRWNNFTDEEIKQLIYTGKIK